jgi:hypothetical protein
LKDVRAWDRLPGESSPAYAAASLYFELGPGRSQEAVGRKLAKSRTLISRWAARYNWVERAGLYDEHLFRLRRRTREKAEAAEAQKWARRRAEQREVGYEISRSLIDKARRMLRLPLVEVKRQEVKEGYEDGREKTVQINIFKPVRFSAADAARMLVTADRLTRLALSMPLSHTGMTEAEERIESETPSCHPEALTDEELERIARAGS